MTTTIENIYRECTGHTVFEADQVLTHDQLNAVVDWLDGEDRVTRVALIGVGIPCGLRVKRGDPGIVLSSGAGVTTLGDLVVKGAESHFVSYRAYDTGKSGYPPFVVNETPIVAWELLEQKTEARDAIALSELQAASGFALDDMVAVLFVETREEDPDLCSVVDCNNMGKSSRQCPRVLLVDSRTAASLKERIVTWEQRVLGLGQVMEKALGSRELVVPRVTGLADVRTRQALEERILQACEQAIASMSRCFELHELRAAVADLTASGTPADAAAWRKWLLALPATFERNGTGAQYLHDLLRDVAATFNAMLAVLSTDRTVCCPDARAFPHHLLLGGFGKNQSNPAYRTGWYPAAAVASASRSVEHAAFLARKLSVMLTSVGSPARKALTVTPSFREDVDLELRAIPFYYHGKSPELIRDAWSYELTRRGMSRHNYSAFAEEYEPLGGAAAPLASSLERFTFFRIEGHFGQNVRTMVDRLRETVRVQQLPLSIGAVLVGNDRTRLTIKPDVRYSDLHRFHDVLRMELGQEVNDVVGFANTFKQEADRGGSLVTLSTGDTRASTTMASAMAQNETVLVNATALQKSLASSFSTFSQDATWSKSLAQAMTAAGTLQSGFASARASLDATPVASLLKPSKASTIDLIGQLLGQRQQAQDDRLMLRAFLAEHPGAEHQAGAQPGGTFILLYDENAVVVGDVTLPYDWSDSAEPEDPKLDLQVTDFRPGWVGIRKDTGVVASDSFRKLFQGLVTKKPVVTPGTPVIDPAGGRFADLQLGTRMQTLLEKRDLLSSLKVTKDILDPGDEAVRAAIDRKITTAEAEIAVAADDVVTHVATSGADVKAGADGFRALIAVNTVTTALESPAAIERVNSGIDRASEGAPAVTRTVLSNLRLRIRG